MILNGICEGMKSCNGRLVHVYRLISLELHNGAHDNVDNSPRD